jgi:hypothetical protein
VIRGKITNPTVTLLEYELGGVPCLDKLRVERATVTATQVDAKVRSGGLGGELVGKVRIATGGAVKRIDHLQITGRRLDAARLCGLGRAVKGTVDVVEAEVTNATIDPGRPALDWLDHAQIGSVKKFHRIPKTPTTRARPVDAKKAIARAA